MSIEKKSSFTLLEVLVAMMVLGVSLIMIMGVLANARGRLLRAERVWAREHLLTQATEFYLLAGPEAIPPGDIFPEGFSSSCEIEEIGDLPETARQPVNNAVLRIYRVVLYGTDGAPLAERTVEKVVYEAP